MWGETLAYGSSVAHNVSGIPAVGLVAERLPVKDTVLNSVTDDN